MKIETRTEIQGKNVNHVISVALCTFQGERFIEKQIQSLLDQTRVPDEIVLCDDGSQDRTLEIVESLQKKTPIPIAIYKNPERLGSTKNFEKAIRICKGDLIFLSDQDDWWYPEKIEQIESIFAANPSLLCVFSDAELVDEDLNTLKTTMWTILQFDEITKSRFLKSEAFEVLLRYNVVTGATMAISASSREKILPIPKEWVHDAWIALILAYNLNISFIERPLIKYRQHSSQQLGSGDWGFFAQIQRTLNLKSSFFLDEALKMTQLKERLNALGYIKKNPIIERKITHLYSRYTIMEKQKKWAALAISELISGNYHFFSGGLVSCLRDLNITFFKKL